MKIVFSNFVFFMLIYVVYTAPQYPEINDQFDESNHTEAPELKQPEVFRHTEVEKLTEIDNIIQKDTEADNTEKRVETNTTHTSETTTPQTEIIAVEPNVITKLCKTVTEPILTFVKSPKVSVVISNIGTCIVNGAMEIISFYFPAPLIPLIASAAGLIIPFEPVVLLREKLPVTSYRRAFKTAVDGFLGTFDRYKYVDDDPYMTGKFNRRFMDISKEEKTEEKI